MPVVGVSYELKELTQPSQLHALKDQLKDIGVTPTQLTFYVDCDELEEQLLHNCFYDEDSEAPDEDSDDYIAYTQQMLIYDQVFDIEPEEFSHHPIYEVYKELEGCFNHVKMTFNQKLKFVATLS